MKKLINMLLAFTLVLALGFTCYAENNNVKVQFNGEDLSFSSNPTQINGSTFVPIKTILEKLNLKVSYNTNTNTLTANNEKISVVLQANNTVSKITKDNKTSDIKLSGAPQIINGNLFVPVRFISDAFPTTQVGWDEEENTVVIIDYNYFIDNMKTKAPLFYEFLNGEYKQFPSCKSKFDFTFDLKANPKESDSIESFSTPLLGAFDGGIDGSFNALKADTDGSFDFNLIAKGKLKELLNDEKLGLKNLDNIHVNGMFNNNAMYIKSDIVSKIPQLSLLPIKDKYIKINIADLEIPDVKTMQDLMDANQGQSTDAFILQLKMRNAGLVDSYTFEDTKQTFEIASYLLNNDHFKVKEIDKDTKVYTMSFGEKDILDLVSKMSDLSKEDKDEMLKESKDLKINAVIDFTIKNKIVTNENISLKFKYDSTEKGNFELNFNGKLNVEEIDKSSVKINIPKDSDTINFKDLEKLAQ